MKFKFLNIFKKVAKDEIQEVKDIKPTDEQYTKGKALAVIAVAALASSGIPIAAVAEPIIAKVFAYGIADMEAGIEDNQKLIISRVLEEIKKA